MNDMISNLCSGLAGALIGGLITFFVASYQLTEEKKNDLKRQRNRIRGFLEAIQTEIDVAWGQYHERIGTELNSVPESEPFLIILPIYSDYFSVYHANVNLLVEISNEELRRQIVKTYTLAKGQLDSYQYNNRIVEQYELLKSQLEMSDNEILEARKKALYSQLIAYAAKLKFGNNELASQIALLSKSIAIELCYRKQISR